MSSKFEDQPMSCISVWPHIPYKACLQITNLKVSVNDICLHKYCGLQSQQLNVTLETSLLRVAVVADPPFVDNLTGVGRGHLDVQVDVKARRKDGLVAHGVLGQTVNASLVEQQVRLGTLMNMLDPARFLRARISY